MFGDSEFWDDPEDARTLGAVSFDEGNAASGLCAARLDPGTNDPVIRCAIVVPEPNVEWHIVALGAGALMLLSRRRGVAGALGV